MTAAAKEDPLFSDTPATPGNDQRYFPRWQVNNRIVYRCDGEMHPREARSRDLSCAGICLMAPHSLHPAPKIKLKIYLFDDKSIEVEGHTVWTKTIADGHLVGIIFDNTNSETQNVILQYAFEFKKKDVIRHWFEGWDGTRS